MRVRRARFHIPIKPQRKKKTPRHSIGSRKQFIVILKLPQRKEESIDPSQKYQPTLWESFNYDASLDLGISSAAESSLIEQNIDTVHSVRDPVSFSFHATDMDQEVECSAIEDVSPSIYNLFESKASKGEAFVTPCPHSDGHMYLADSFLAPDVSSNSINSKCVAPGDVLLLPPLSNFMGPSSSELCDPIYNNNERSHPIIREMQKESCLESEIATDYCDSDTNCEAAYDMNGIDSSFVHVAPRFLNGAAYGRSYHESSFPNTNNFNSPEYQAELSQGSNKEYSFPSVCTPAPVYQVSMDNMVLYTKSTPPQKYGRDTTQPIGRRKCRH